MQTRQINDNTGAGESIAYSASSENVVESQHPSHHSTTGAPNGGTVWQDVPSRVRRFKKFASQHMEHDVQMQMYSNPGHVTLLELTTMKDPCGAAAKPGSALQAIPVAYTTVHGLTVVAALHWGQTIIDASHSLQKAFSWHTI